MNYMIIWIGIAIILLAILAFFLTKKTREETKKTGKYPEGHFLGRGIGIGIALGMGFGVAIDNIGLGPALGLPIGVAIGMAQEKKAKEAGKLRPLTKEEENRKKWGVITGIGGLIVLLIIVLGVYWLG